MQSVLASLEDLEIILNMLRPARAALPAVFAAVDLPSIFDFVKWLRVGEEGCPTLEQAKARLKELYPSKPGWPDTTLVISHSKRMAVNAAANRALAPQTSKLLHRFGVPRIGDTWVLPNCNTKNSPQSMRVWPGLRLIGEDTQGGLCGRGGSGAGRSEAGQRRAAEEPGAAAGHHFGSRSFWLKGEALLVGSSPPGFGCLVLGLPLVRLRSFSFLVARRGATDCMGGRPSINKLSPGSCPGQQQLCVKTSVLSRRRRKKKKTGKNKISLGDRPTFSQHHWAGPVYKTALGDRPSSNNQSALLGAGPVLLAFAAFFVSPPSAPVPVSPRGQTQKGARKKKNNNKKLEVGGRWGEETEAFLHRIAQGRALASPAAQRTAVAAAYRRRWGQMLAVAAQGTFAASLCQLPTDVGDAYASAPLEGDVLSDARWAPGA